MIKRLSIIVAFLLIPVAAARADDALRLQYKFTTGDVLRYQTITESISDLGADTSGPRWTRKTTEFRFEVLGVDANGAAKVRLTTESFRMQQCGVHGCEVFDSRHPEAPQSDGEKFMANLAVGVGVPIEFRLSPDGRVTELNMDRMMEVAQEKFGQDPESGKMLAGMWAALKSGNAGTGAGIRFAEFPPSEVKLGEHWEAKPTSFPTPLGTSTEQGGSELEGIEVRTDGRRAHILSNRRMTVDTSTGTISHPAGMKLEIGPTQTTEQVVFDVERGRLVRSETENTTEMTFPSLPGRPDDQHLKGQTSVTTVTTVTTLIEVGKKP